MSLAETQLKADPRRFGLWRSVWKLLVLRMRISWNIFKRSKTRNKIGRVIVMLIIVGGMVFLYWVSSLLLRFLQSPELAQMIDPTEFLRVIPTLVLTGAFVVIILTNFGVLLQSLYLSRDMDFLVTKPIPMRAVFIAKLLEGILPNFGLFSAFSLPVLIGLGAAGGYNFLFYPLLFVLLGVLALAAGGLASILVMAVVRLVPAKRVAEVLGFLGATVSILCGQSYNLMNAAGVEFDQTDVAGMLSTLSSINTPWSPLAWAGRGLDLVGRGSWLPGLGLSLLALVIAAAVFAGTLLLAQNLYYTGWSSMQGSLRKKRAKTKTVTAASDAGAPAAVDARQALGSTVVSNDALQAQAERGGLLAWIPRPVRGIIWKDALLLRRDPRNLSQFITPLILGVVMMFTTGARRGNDILLDDIGPFSADMVQAFSLLALSTLVGWMLLIGLGTMAFSREGKNYWFLQAAPVRARDLLAGKFLVSYIPTLAFGVAYLIFGYIVRGITWWSFPYIALALMMTMAGATAISLAFGAAGAKMDWDNPTQQRLRGASGCFVFLAVFGFQALDLVLFLLPVALYTFFIGPPPFWMYLVGGILGTGAAVMAILIPLRLVAPRLSSLGES